MLIFCGIFLISLIVPFLFKLKFKRRVTFLEWGACSLGAMLISFGVFKLGSFGALQDTEVWNGHVTSLQTVKKDCQYPGWYDYSDSFCTNENTREVYSHTEYYECGTTKSPQTCSRDVYDTEYSYDYPWEKKYYVNSTLKQFMIRRVDDRGAKVPPRYTSTQVGDPVSITKSYTNYLKAADMSILNPQNIAVSEQELALVPSYPIGIYDYYKINRFVQVGSKIPAAEVAKWNSGISEVAKVVGPVKQANPVIVVTDQPQYIRYAIERKWNGGKKNDIIVLIGVDGDKVEWVDVITFLSNTGNEFMTRQLQTMITEVGTLDRDAILNITQKTIIEKFDRKPMQSVEYLKDEFEPPLWVKITALLCSLILSIIFSIIATRNYIMEKR